MLGSSDDRRWSHGLAWPLFVLLALIVFELTANSTLGIVVLCAKFGWSDLLGEVVQICTIVGLTVLQVSLAFSVMWVKEGAKSAIAIAPTDCWG